ncbi:hypothetical protein HPP92_009074 [Vanilla planifolia]|uniref:Uncharacterized protein n=1 Tax=Vanilla planifolia TaxID=51239 RepID=A0A835R9L6_VANPL|nr:hypothetical protein HPP92_009074 [Vanilla planifolia]
MKEHVRKVDELNKVKVAAAAMFHLWINRNMHMHEGLVLVSNYPFSSYKLEASYLAFVLVLLVIFVLLLSATMVEIYASNPIINPLMHGHSSNVRKSKLTDGTAKVAIGFCFVRFTGSPGGAEFRSSSRRGNDDRKGYTCRAPLLLPSLHIYKISVIDIRQIRPATPPGIFGCGVLNSIITPSNSFRSNSTSSSDNEGLCAAMIACLARSTNPPRHPNITSSKVAPLSVITNIEVTTATPRLVRSHALTRDLVRDWNFDELLVES